MAGSLRVLACQIEIPAFTGAPARDRHLARLTARIRAELAVADADLVVLPELSSVPSDEALGGRLAGPAVPPGWQRNARKSLRTLCARAFPSFSGYSKASGNDI